MLDRLLTWHQQKHTSYVLTNSANHQSLAQLEQLCADILSPIEQKFGRISITYGFTSAEFLRHILKHSPGDMAPEIDQHASMERNTRGNRICKRDGASCDFYVEDYRQKMDEIANFIVNTLPFDRLYFYGKDKPIHISIGPEQSHYALIRTPRRDGIRVNKKSGQGDAAKRLFHHYNE
ncbi:hypothetical protein [Photobacterium sp. TY1-4]|uniref:hypothetical protein n=1 Tax=Photobacterium sp. TY1-4 TaxID=2899122 RepID=UPI0021BE1033|nr:hypothetical protein [Photobacterium sp. TY1-4]UXI00770.1 hypothetical protein NH461_13315 [Photobacterium sp. TY1-4]